MPNIINNIFNIINSYHISLIGASTQFVRSNNLLQKGSDFENNSIPLISINNSLSLDLKTIERNIQIIKINRDND